MFTRAISAGEERFIADGVIAGVRADGRNRLQYREMLLATGIFPQCYGSARATIAVDRTDVIASVKIELEQPDAASPDRGSLAVAASCWASVASSMVGRSADDASAQLAQTLKGCVRPQSCLHPWQCFHLVVRMPPMKSDAELYNGMPARTRWFPRTRATHASSLRSLLVDSNAIDTRLLSILPGKYAWRIYVDVLVLGDGGSLVDTACAAAVAALTDTRLPRLRLFRGEADGDWDLEVDDDPHAGTAIPGIASAPLAVTFTQVGGCSIVDASCSEEECAQSRAVLGVTRAGRVVYMRADGRAGVEPAHLLECARVGERVAPVLFDRIDAALAQASSVVAAAAERGGGGSANSGSAGDGLNRPRSLASGRDGMLIGAENIVMLDGGSGGGAAGSAHKMGSASDSRCA